MSAEIFSVQGAQIGQKYGDCETLAEIIVRLESEVKARGRVVCAVTVNGLKLDESDEKRLANTRVHEVKSLDVETEEPQELMRSTVVSQLQLIEEMQRLGVSISEAYRGLDLSRGQTQLIALFEGCRWLADGLLALRDARALFKVSEANRLDWRLNEQEFRRVVSETLAAFERRDYLLLADLLEYDLSNAFDRWRDLLKT